MALVVVPSASVAPVPQGTSLEAAATLPMNSRSLGHPWPAQHPVAWIEPSNQFSLGESARPERELSLRPLLLSPLTCKQKVLKAQPLQVGFSKRSAKRMVALG